METKPEIFQSAIGKSLVVFVSYEAKQKNQIEAQQSGFDLERRSGPDLNPLRGLGGIYRRRWASPREGVAHPKEKTGRKTGFFFWRRHPDLNWGIADLQSAALPLGYGAI